jgi:hypothetical protein
MKPRCAGGRGHPLCELRVALSERCDRVDKHGILFNDTKVNSSQPQSAAWQRLALAHVASVVPPSGRGAQLNKPQQSRRRATGGGTTAAWQDDASV